MRNYFFSLALLVLGGLTAPAVGQTERLELHNDGVRFPDGSFLTSAAGSYSNGLVVAKSGGHYTSIQAALDGITDASQENPYLVWVGPGIYDEQVIMKPWVAIHGAGRDLTTIRSTAGGETGCDQGTVVGADDAELRSLTVLNDGAGTDCATAMYNSGDSPVVTDVRLMAIGGPFNVGLINANGSSPLLRWVRLEIGSLLSEPLPDSIGVWSLAGSSPRVLDSVVIAVAADRARGFLSQSASLLTLQGSFVEAIAVTESADVRLEGGSEARIYDSVLASEDEAVSSDGSTTCRIAHSELQGTLADCSCVGAFDPDFAELDDSCQLVSP